MPVDARRLRAIANAASQADELTTVGKAPATQALMPSLGAAPKRGKGGVDNSVTMAQVRQMAFSPDPADRQLLREMVASMTPEQQNNLFLRMNAEMRDARAGVDVKGNPRAELSPEGQLLREIIWEGAEPPPEKLAAIEAARDVGGLGDVDLENVADEAPKGAPYRQKAEVPKGVKDTELHDEKRFQVNQRVTGKDGSVQIKNTDERIPRADRARIRAAERGESVRPVSDAAAASGESSPLEEYQRRLLRAGELIDPRMADAGDANAAFRNFDTDSPDRAVMDAGGGSALPGTGGKPGRANAAARMSAGNMADLDYLLRQRGVFNPNLFKSPQELAKFLTEGMPQDAFTAIPLTQGDRARALDAIGGQADVLDTSDLPSGLQLSDEGRRSVAYNAVKGEAPDVVARGSLDGDESGVGRRTVQNQFIDNLARKLDEYYGSFGWGDDFRGPHLQADPDGNWQSVNRIPGAESMEAAPAGGLGDLSDPVIADLPGHVSPPTFNPNRVQGTNPTQDFNPQAVDIYESKVDPDFPEDGPRQFLDPDKVARREAEAKASGTVKGAGPAGDLTGSNKKIAEGRASKRNPVIQMLEEQHGRKFTTRRTMEIRQELQSKNLPKGDPERVALEKELRDALLIDDYLLPPDRMAKTKGGKRRGSKAPKAEEAPKADNPADVQAEALDNAATEIADDGIIDAEFDLKPNPEPPGPVVNDIGTNYTVTGRRPPDPVEPATTTDLIPVGPAHDPRVHTDWVPGNGTAPERGLIVRPPDAPTPNAPGTPSTSRIRSVLNSVTDNPATRYVRKHPIRSAIAGGAGLVGLSAYLNSGNSPDGYVQAGGGGMGAEEAARIEAFQNTFGPSIHASMTPEARIRAAIRRSGGGGNGGNGSGLNPNTQILQNWNY